MPCASEREVLIGVDQAEETAECNPPGECNLCRFRPRAKKNADGGSDTNGMYMKLGAIVVGSLLITVALHKSGMWQPLLSVAMEWWFTSVGP